MVIFVVQLHLLVRKLVAPVHSISVLRQRPKVGRREPKLADVCDDNPGRQRVRPETAAPLRCFPEASRHNDAGRDHRWLLASKHARQAAVPVDDKRRSGSPGIEHRVELERGVPAFVYDYLEWCIGVACSRRPHSYERGGDGAVLAAGTVAYVVVDTRPNAVQKRNNQEVTR